jgi:hypothetical protein
MYNSPKQTKMSFFLLQNQRTEKAEKVLSVGLVLVWGKDVGKGCEKVNMVQTLCTHVCRKN